MEDYFGNTLVASDRVVYCSVHGGMKYYRIGEVLGPGQGKYVIVKWLTKGDRWVQKETTEVDPKNLVRIA